MQLTEEQRNTKTAITERLLAIKENAYHNLMSMQNKDLGEAKETQEEDHNLFEDGKVDQSINRVEARASVVEALSRDIDILSNIDSINETEEVQLGDVIETDQGNFFVAVASDAFEVNGKEYRGISTDSPLYKALRGKHDGDVVEVNGNKFTLKSSY